MTPEPEYDDMGGYEAEDPFVSSRDVRRLEEAWRKNPEATIDDLDAIDAAGEEEDVRETERVYDDGYHFQNVLAPLINMEADRDREMKESLSEGSISLEWDRSLNGRKVAIFKLGHDNDESRVMIGDELTLRLEQAGEFLNGGRKFEASGYVKFVMNSKIHLELRVQNVPEKVTTNYIVEFIWKSTSYDRMQDALKTFAVDDKSVSGYIYHAILGHKVEEQELDVKVPEAAELDAPNLPSLNESQKAVLESVLKKPFSLIQGPPGTGKTVTSATLVYHLSRQDVGQVLVAAPSNVAVDQLTEKIAATGLKVVRLASKTREEAAKIQASDVDHLCLHSIVREVAPPELKKLFKLKDEMGELNKKDEGVFKRLKNKTERKILQAADVVCTTAVMAGDRRLDNFRFRQVLIDEATQAVEPEALIPITLGCKQLVMVGDHCQLPPVVMDKKAAKAGLTQSLFERLVLTGVRPARLRIQYRMHPALASFPSNMFYEGSLGNGVSEEERTEAHKNGTFPWPTQKPMMFYNCSGGMEEISASGTSYLNRAEAHFVEKVVTQLLKLGVKASEIGVITPYDGQRSYVTDFIKRCGSMGSALYDQVEVASVDAFQGREKDYIIFSAVRSGETGGIGFVADPRRLNVAMTRARLGLVVAGNARVLCKNMLWAAMVMHFRENECLVEGTLANLTASALLIPKPRSRRGDDRTYARTALARGGWSGKWDSDGTTRVKSGDGRGGGKGRAYRDRKGRSNDMDSRYDPRYADATKGLASVAEESASGDLKFAPLPSYAGDGSAFAAGDDDLASQPPPPDYGTQYSQFSQSSTEGYGYRQGDSQAGSQFSQNTDGGFDNYYYDAS